MTDLMLKLRKHFLVLLIGIPLLLHLGACAPESTQGTTSDPEYGKGSLTVTISDTDLDENGRSANITVKLDSPPKENVAVIATSSDPSEAQFVVNNQFQSGAELLFTDVNWDVPQILKIQGQYDEIIDGTQNVFVSLEILSDDPVYSNPDINLTDPTGGPTNLINDIDQVFRNFDNTPSDGISSFTTTGTVTELNPNEPGFKQATFPIQLTSKPSSNVGVSIDFTSGTSEIADALLSISPPSRVLTFTPENWKISQSFIITAKQENVDYSSNDNFILDIKFSSSSPYFNKPSQKINITREDNDVPGIFVDYPNLMTTSESGNKVTLGVRLKMKPDENVTVKFVSSDISEGKITSSNQGTLTFSRDGWNITQNIEVTGQPDGAADTDQLYYLTYTFSGDPIYESINSNILKTDPPFTNQDKNTPGLTMALGNLGLSESGNCDYLAVRLNTKPINFVTVEPSITSNSPNKEAEFVNDRTGCTNSNQIIGNCQPSPLSFNSSNWIQSQLICIKGEDDSDIDGSHQITLSISSLSEDSNYKGLSREFNLTNTDNDYAGILLGSVQYMRSQGKYVLPVQLRAKPSSTVTVQLANDTLQIIKDVFETSSINFNNNNWNQQQFFNLKTGVDLNAEITLQATGGGFNTAATTSLNLRSDNSSAAAGYEFVYFKEEAERSTSDDGGVYAFRLKLRNQPTAPVYLKLRSDNSSIGNPNRTGITLDSTNWSLGEEIKVIGLDDNLNGNQPYRIQFYDVSSTDPNYDNLTPQDVHLVNLDDDYRPSPLSSDTYEFDNTTTTSNSCKATGEISGDTSDFNISLPISVVKETDSPVATIKIALSQPIEGTVKLRVFSEDESEGYLIDEGNNSINFQDITFNKSSATTYQDIKILGSQDWIDDGHQRFKIQISVLNTNIPGYFGKSVSICLENEDDDNSGIEFNFGMSDENLLATSTFQDETTLGVRLLSEPENEVLLNFGSTNNFITSPNTLTLSSEQWSEFQEITVINKSTASISDNLSVTFNTNDPAYSNIFSFTDINNFYFQNKIPVYYQDDELQDLLIYMPKNEYINESGAQQEFTVKLRSKPSSGKEVFLPLSTSDASEGRVSPTILIFDSTTWQTPQTIRVTGIDDYQIDGNQQFEVVIGAAAAFQNADPNYTTPERIVRFISLDSTEAGFIVYALDEQTDEAGGDAQVTIQLKSKPKADVIISASSTDTTKAVITQGSFLTFTTSNWFQPQTIKLIGLADGSTANDQDYSLEFSNSSSDDSNYDGLKIQSVPLKHLNLN